MSILRNLLICIILSSLKVSFEISVDAQIKSKNMLYQKKRSNGKLIGKISTSFMSRSLPMCAMACLNKPNCQSFNYIQSTPDNGGTSGTCELLSEVPATLNVTEFQQQNGANYFEIYYTSEIQQVDDISPKNRAGKNATDTRCFSSALRQMNKFRNAFQIWEKIVCFSLYLGVVRNGSQANESCSANGEIMAEARTLQDLKLLVAILSDKIKTNPPQNDDLTWIGSTGYGQYATWYWNNGDVVVAPLFWFPGDPNGPSNAMSCPGMKHTENFLAVDRLCTEQHSFFCEYRYATAIYND